MNVNEVYKIVLYACSKNLQNGYISPDDFNQVINQAQREYLDYLIGEYQKYQVGRPIAVVENSNKEKIRNSIAPLIYNTILSPNTTTGIAPYPSDYEISDTMWTLYGYYNIRFIGQPRLSSFYNSFIDPIATNPVYLLEHEGFRFFPPDIGGAKLGYIRTPPSIVWGYNLDSNGIPTWNPATSQNPVWSDTDMMNIIVRALQIIGVNLDSNSVSQFAAQIKNLGQ